VGTWPLFISVFPRHIRLFEYELVAKHELIGTSRAVKLPFRNVLLVLHCGLDDDLKTRGRLPRSKNPSLWDDNVLIRSLARTLPLLVLTPLLGACTMNGPLSIFETAGPVAKDQLDLLIYTYYLSWIVIILVGGVMIYALVRFRRRQGSDEIPPQTHGNPALEIAWTIIPIVLIVLVAVPGVRTIFRTETIAKPTPEDVIINVIGHQWWWSFEYPELGIVTANEIHIPEDRRVILNMTSADVLHSFWVPQIAGKRDLIPNQNNQLWFIAEEPGVYRSQCAELCLGPHAYMRGRVIVDTEDDFATWVSKFQAVQKDGVLPNQMQTATEVAWGQQLFGQKCAACHTVAGFAEDVTVGEAIYPNLTNFGLRTTIAAGVLANNSDNLALWLRNPQAVKPGNRMPNLWSSSNANREEEIAAVVAYLLSLGNEDTLSAHASAR
jgi:cytochrome c oxidase subunit 2